MARVVAFVKGLFKRRADKRRAGKRRAGTDGSTESAEPGPRSASAPAELRGAVAGRPPKAPPTPLAGGGRELLETLDKLRQAQPEGERMLLFEGEYNSTHVFVRDIMLDEDELAAEDVLEATIATSRALDHPNLTKVVLAHRQGKRVVVLSERAEESVEDKIRKSRSICFEETLTKEDAILVAIDVCMAASYLHSQGVYGFTLKPSSVLCFPGGTFKLSESCISPTFAGASMATNTHRIVRPSGANGTVATAVRAVESNEEANAKTFPLRRGEMDSSFLQHPEYQAPEVLRGDPNCGPEADVFSFGMFLWQLLHLRRAYPSGWGPMMILQSLQADHRPRLDTSVINVESPLRKVIEMSWATDPDARPSFEQLGRMLQIVRQSSMVSKRTPDAVYQLPYRRTSRYRFGAKRYDSAHSKGPTEAYFEPPGSPSAAPEPVLVGVPPPQQPQPQPQPQQQPQQQQQQQQQPSPLQLPLQLPLSPSLASASAPALDLGSLNAPFTAPPPLALPMRAPVSPAAGLQLETPRSGSTLSLSSLPSPSSASITSATSSPFVAGCGVFAWDAKRREYMVGVVQGVTNVPGTPATVGVVPLGAQRRGPPPPVWLPVCDAVPFDAPEALLKREAILLSQRLQAVRSLAVGLSSMAA